MIGKIRFSPRSFPAGKVLRGKCRGRILGRRGDADYVSGATKSGKILSGGMRRPAGRRRAGDRRAGAGSGGRRFGREKRDDSPGRGREEGNRDFLTRGEARVLTPGEKRETPRVSLHILWRRHPDLNRGMGDLQSTESPFMYLVIYCICVCCVFFVGLYVDPAPRTAPLLAVS